jgi:predicted MFS family arabinose efflux permease
MVEVSRDLVAAQHQGKALGLMSSGTSYGVFINSFLLTWLLPAFGCRSLWWATALFVLLLTLFALLRLRRAGVRKDGRDTASAPPKQSFHQRLARLPKGPSIAILTMMFLNGLSCMPYQTYLSAFLLAEAGYSDQMAAYAWRIMGLIGMVSGFALGALADRITVRWAMVVTYGILSLSCLTLLTSIGGQSPIFVGIAAILFGLSFYPIFGLVPAYISQVFGEGDAALIFAFGNIALGLGGMLGNMAGGWLKQSLDSFQPIYWIMLGAAIASILLSLVMRNEKEARVLAYQSNSK